MKMRVRVFSPAAAQSHPMVFSFSGNKATLYSDLLQSTHRYIFRTTACLASTEQVKSILLTVVISVPALSCVLKIIELGGKYFYVYVWGFMFVFSIVMLTIVPVVIMPLFNTYSPLEVMALDFRLQRWNQFQWGIGFAK